LPTNETMCAILAIARKEYVIGPFAANLWCLGYAIIALRSSRNSEDYEESVQPPAFPALPTPGYLLGNRYCQ
jgi:hypothetical protein